MNATGLLPPGPPASQVVMAWRYRQCRFGPDGREIAVSGSAPVALCPNSGSQRGSGVAIPPERHGPRSHASGNRQTRTGLATVAVQRVISSSIGPKIFKLVMVWLLLACAGGRCLPTLQGLSQNYTLAKTACRIQKASMQPFARLVHA